MSIMQSGIFLIISTNLLGTRTTVLASLAHCSTSSRTRAAKSATSTMFGCSAIMVCDLTMVILLMMMTILMMNMMAKIVMMMMMVIMILDPEIDNFHFLRR